MTTLIARVKEDAELLNALAVGSPEALADARRRLAENIRKGQEALARYDAQEREPFNMDDIEGAENL